MSTDISRAAVNLAEEPGFRLGALDITPSRGEVVCKGERQTLQPRVMQVLVAMARNQDRVLSRDQLVDLCWDGRVIGDDAIHRCMAILRRLGEQSGAFSVETVPRIGHRLQLSEPVRPKARRVSWPAIAVLAAVLVAAGAAGAWWALRPPPASTLAVQIVPFEHSGPLGQGSALAARVSGEIAGMLNETGVPTTSVAGSAGKSTNVDLRLRGALRLDGQRVSVRVFLDDPVKPLTLWTANFEGRADQIDRLEDQVAAATIETVVTALEPSTQRGLKVDPETLAIHIRGSAIVRSPELFHEGDGRRAFEQVVQRAPDFAMGHGVLAVALANEARRAPAPLREELRKRSEDAARKAISIDPASAGAGYDALYMLQRQRAPNDLRAAERILLEGLKAAPDFPFLAMRRCRFLIEVGRAEESLPPCQRALALRPMAGPIGYTYARALAANGDFRLASEAIERAIRYNPDHANTRQTRFELAAFEGSAATAAGLLAHEETAPPFIAPQGRRALEAYLRARESGRSADVAHALSALTGAVKQGRLSPSLAVAGATVLGRGEAAFALMTLPAFQQEIDRVGPSILMEPSLEGLRRDPRFWAATARAGLVGYWTAGRRWPDFCGDQLLQSECERLAREALETASSRAERASQRPGIAAALEMRGVPR